MKPSKVVAGLLIISLLFAGTLPVAAAPKKKKDKKPAGPITIVADELYFSDKTGELFAKGNVVITQDKSRITANLIRGNDKQTEVWTDDAARLTEPRTDVTGMKMRYNYGLQTGNMQNIKGQCGDDFISGKNIHFEEGKITAYGATTTGCPAKGTPDYRVTARKVEIWPDDKMIAYDAKVWIKNFVIYSTPRYRKSLKKKDQETEYPTFGYQDPDGYWITQRLSYALNENLSAYTDLTYYTKTGFKPTFGLVDQEKNYTIRLVQGEFRDDNSNWVKKEPEFKFEWHSKPIGNLPWNYTFSALIGKWTDTTKSSWHQDYILYFTRKPIYFDEKKTWTWTNGWGLEQVRESYDGSIQNIIKYNTSISKRLTPWLLVFTGYNYTNNNNTAFAYNRTDVAQEWVRGFDIRIDRKTMVSFSNSYNLTTGETYENYYTLHRNLHCWDTYVQYQAKKQRFIWNLTVLRF